MAIDSRTLFSSQPIGIPGQQARGQQDSYGSSPPVRLPAFGPSSSATKITSSSSLSRSPAVVTSCDTLMSRRKRSPRGQPALEISSDGLLLDDPIVPISTSFFSTLSIEDFDSDGLSEIRSSLPRGPALGTESCYNRISKQGRKILRSSRLPIEHILEFEHLVFDHLQSKTPRHRVLHDEEHFFVVTIQNPFRRSLLHSVCQYYQLISQSSKFLFLLWKLIACSCRQDSRCHCNSGNCIDITIATSTLERLLGRDFWSCTPQRIINRSGFCIFVNII